MKITTKTGDDGSTGLFMGKRVGKDCELIDLLGELDELQAFAGWAKISLPENEDGKVVAQIMDKIEDDLYRIMSIAGYEMIVPKNIRDIDFEDIAFLEKEIENRQSEVKDLNEFVRPGKSEAVCRMHIARCVCRRVERKFVAYLKQKRQQGTISTTEIEIAKYLNRLSDLFFIFAYRL